MNVVVLHDPSVSKAFLSGDQIRFFLLPCPLFSRPFVLIYGKIFIDLYLLFHSSTNDNSSQQTKGRENIKDWTIDPILILLQNLPKGGSNKNATLGISNVHFSNSFFYHDLPWFILILMEFSIMVTKFQSTAQLRIS